MVKIAWKTIKGYGPYAYLQESVKLKSGQVVSKHLAYLGKAGAGGLVPGYGFRVPGKVAEYGGKTVPVPEVSPDIVAKLNPKSIKLVQHMQEQAEAGLPKGAVTTTAPKTSAQGKAAEVAQLTADKVKDAGPEGKVTPAQVAEKLEAAVEAKAAAGKPKDKYIVFSTKPGPKTTAVGQLTATLQEALAGKPGAPIKAVWTKVGPKMETPPAGSTRTSWATSTTSSVLRPTTT